MPKMQRDSTASLWSLLNAAGNLSARVSLGGRASVSWSDLAAESFLIDRAAELRGQSVLIAMADQLAAAAAFVQLDGVARRIVLCPPDISRDHLAFVAGCAAADIVLTDAPALETIYPRVDRIVPGSRKNAPGDSDPNPQIETEWVLLTSGTTGLPKLVAHTLASLVGAIEQVQPSSVSVVWSTFYDIRRYGGLQIFLRAALTGTPLILPGAQESIADFLVRAGAHGVTHISGTPSHWRRALMSSSADRISPAYVRLSGEIADQAILNQLRAQYPAARIAHAFASTEAGVAFDVNDGFAGFPVDTLLHTPNVAMKVEGGTLRIRSDRNAARYLGESRQGLKDAEGFVDTGDAVEAQNGRYFFVGRRDGTINVGGAKVHPEEVEAVINRHPAVGVSLVRTKKNPITGALVIADVMLKTRLQGEDRAQALQSDILRFCRAELAPHKVPVAINFVPTLAMAETGKLIRPDA